MTRQRGTLLGIALATAVLATACPERARERGGEAPGPCKSVGQRCEFAPGKLGTCVVDDQCQGPSCFVCQSQH